MNITDIQGKLEQLNAALEAQGYIDPKCKINIGVNSSGFQFCIYLNATDLDLDFVYGTSISEAFDDAMAQVSK